ncbi:MAG: TraR/DksA C4-type zinc finger protein [Tumebacillaceae bacterium]
MNLTNEQLNNLRSELEEEMTDLRDRLDVTDGYGMNDSLETTTGELSHYDNHPADLGSEVFERGKDLALRDRDSLRLNAIDEALERLEDGTYGTCQHCNGGIPYERLEANPAAKFCVSCQEEADEHEISANRPVEENFLYPGFGRTFMDEKDQTGYDGEDAWQDVARYGTASTNDDAPYALSPNHFYTDSDERIGYVEDIEGFTITDMEGNPLPDPQYVRNEAYQRAWSKANAEQYSDEYVDHYEDPPL